MITTETEKLILLKTESRKTVRRPIAQVRITWGGNGIDLADARVDSDKENITTKPFLQQVVHGQGAQKKWLFCNDIEDTASGNLPNSLCLLDDDNINNQPCAMPDKDDEGYLVGWWNAGTELSNSEGNFTQPYKLSITFPPIPIRSFRLQGYQAQGNDHAEWPVDFIVRAYNENDAIEPIGTAIVNGNTDVEYEGYFDETQIHVKKLEFEISRWSHRNAFIKITAAFDDFTRTYTSDDILSMSILEETEGVIGTLPVGAISCNEMDLTLQNIDDDFFIGNIFSEVFGAVRANRRIQPLLGFKIGDKEELIPKGVFWSSDWNMSERGTGASTTAIDRLGLLQRVDYNGLGEFDNPDAIPEETYWEKDTSLYKVAVDVLTDLRKYYMNDLVFDVDPELEKIIIPIAFFSRQSYFDLIKTIAQAGLAYAYMDTPTQKDIDSDDVVKLNIDCIDVLRIKKIQSFSPAGDFNAFVEPITNDDYIDKTISLRHDNIVNIIKVPYQKYRINDQNIPEPDGDKMYHKEKNIDSIDELGRIEFEYPSNTLIQDDKCAEKIAQTILSTFGAGQTTAEISTFGDVTLKICDIRTVPEYQKRNINSRGYYAVSRIQTEYNGSLRQSLSLRRANSLGVPTITIEETGNANLDIIENGNRPQSIEERY